MYNTESSFTPELNLKVDDLLFYQDASIDQQKGIELYQQYISEGKYEEVYKSVDFFEKIYDCIELLF